jgi:hypothetical protein
MSRSREDKGHAGVEVKTACDAEEVIELDGIFWLSK